MLARAKSGKLESVGATQWGENRIENYAAYADFMLKYGIIKEKVAAADLVPNDLIADINKFGQKAVEGVQVAAISVL